MVKHKRFIFMAETILAWGRGCCCCDDFVSIDAGDNFGAMFGGIRKEGTGHVLLVTGGTAQTAVATVLAQAVPA